MTKVTVDLNSFKDAVRWVTKTFDARDDKAFVSLEVNAEGVGVLAVANARSYLKSYFNVLSSDIDDVFSAALQGQYIQRLANTLTASGDEKATITFKDGSLKLKSKMGTFTIPTFKTRKVAEPTLETLGEVDSREFFDTLGKLSKLTDPNAEMYPQFSAVVLKLNNEEKNASLLATDRFVLGEIDISFSPNDEDDDLTFDFDNVVLLPSDAATSVNEAKSDAFPTKLVYEDTSKKLGYQFADGRVAVFALVEATPLKTQKLKDSALENLTNSVVVSTKDWRNAIQSITNLAWNEDDTFFEVSSKGFWVRDESSSNKLEVSCLSNDVSEDGTICFARAVITKAFAPLTAPSVRIRWSETNKAIVFEPVLDDEKTDESVFLLGMPRNQ